MEISLVLFLAVTVPLLQAGPIIMDSRSSTAIITKSNGNTVTTFISSNVGTVIPAIDPQAQLIWDGACATALTLGVPATVPCGYDLTVFVHTSSDVSFRSGTSRLTGEQFIVLHAAALAAVCGIPITIGVQQCQSTGCVPGTTGIAFTSYVTPVPTGTTCPSGCDTCTTDYLSCLTCLQHNYRVATPDATGQCPCLPGFYMHPSAKICLACPLNQNCQTCGYISSAGAVQCTSCYCNQHRTLNPATNTCDCDTTHTQDGANAYCIKI